ncbi:MAG: hypothetical protein ACO25G_04895 [Holophagaceae bacterium]|jgi:hypothetical protein
MTKRLLKLFLIWATLKSLTWAFYFYGPFFFNQYSEFTGALFSSHAKLLLQRDLAYPRDLFISIDEGALSDHQKAHLTKVPRQIGTGKEALYRIGNLDLLILDKPTPERSYNGKVMCQVFFSYRFNENSDFIQMKELGILEESPAILKYIPQFNQVTLEKGWLNWQVQDKENLLLSVPGNPNSYSFKKLVLFLSPLTPW